MRKILFLTILTVFCAAQAQKTVALGDEQFGQYYQQRVTHFRSLAPAGSHSIVFLGDSITDAAEWTELFGKKGIINRGISGDITAGVLHRLDEVIRHKPKIIFLLIGTNDLARKVAPDEVLENIRKIVRRVAAGSPRTKVNVQSIFPINPAFSKFQDHVKSRDLIESVNDQLKRDADPYGFTYIDVAAALNDSEG